MEHTIITKNKIELICQLKKRPLKINLREFKNETQFNLTKYKQPVFIILNKLSTEVWTLFHIPWNILGLFKF